MHLKPMKKSADAAEHDPLVAIAGGGGVTLCNSMGTAWTADYLKITGELDVVACSASRKTSRRPCRPAEVECAVGWEPADSV
jgi:hypothetical protein